MANKKSGSVQGMERRKHPRLTCTIDIFTEISYGRDDGYSSSGGSGYLSIPGPEKQRARIIDLSLGGAKLLAKSPVRKGTFVTIRIMSSSKIPPIEGKAKVAWYTKNTAPELVYYHMGIAFYDFGWRQRLRLRRLIRRLTGESS